MPAVCVAHVRFVWMMPVMRLSLVVYEMMVMALMMCVVLVVCVMLGMRV
jgi:hypothetical protein